jgi:hypothetical protein
VFFKTSVFSTKKTQILPQKTLVLGEKTLVLKNTKIQEIIELVNVKLNTLKKQTTYQ